MTIRARPPRPAMAALAALLLAGCAQDFVPASVVVDRRILALIADPPELDGTQAGAAATVRAVEAQPLDPPPLRAGATLVRRWSLCPFSLGASAGYGCAVPTCETPLAADAGGAVTVTQPGLVALVEACLAQPGVTPPPGLGGGTFPPVSEVLVRYRLVDVVPGQEDLPLREAVQRLPVWNQPPTRPLNALPAFAATAVTVDGAPAQPCADPTVADIDACPVTGVLGRGAPLAVAAAVDPSTIEDYATGDRTATEVFALSFFTTAGRFDHDTGSATREQPVVEVALKPEAIPAGTTDLLLWVTLRDLRGGEAAAGPYRVAVSP